MDSRQSKLHPELVDQLKLSTQTQHFNEGGNFRHPPKLRVYCTSLVNNDVFGKWVRLFSHDQRSPHYLLPLALYFCWTHGIPLIIQHFPSWRLRLQTLVARKVFAALEVPQNFVVTMSQHRHVLATNLAMTEFCRKICGPSHKTLPNITSPQAFFILYVLLERNRSRGSPMSLSSPLVSLVSPNRGKARDGLCSTCSNRLKTSSNPVKSKGA